MGGRARRISNSAPDARSNCVAPSTCLPRSQPHLAAA